jgi:hypothetical protein
MNNDENSSLYYKLFVDFTAATIAGCLATPFVSIIDKAIVKSTANKTKLSNNFFNEVKQIKRPNIFFRSPQFLMVWGVYSATYLTANWSDTLTTEFKFNENEKELTKLGSTTTVNMIACILKDKAFAINYGINPISTFPIISYNLFLARDILSIGSSFTLPKYISQKIFDETGHNYETETQLILPGIFQFITTPIHLLSLDYYNRPNVTFKNRMIYTSEFYKSSVFARVLRLSWSFGLGGVANTKIKNTFN